MSRSRERLFGAGLGLCLLLQSAAIGVADVPDVSPVEHNWEEGFAYHLDAAQFLKPTIKPAFSLPEATSDSRVELGGSSRLEPDNVPPVENTALLFPINRSPPA